MSDWDRFKTEINLSQYAAYLGYELDKKNSTSSSIKMRHGSDIVIISKKGGVWIYFSVVDDTDNGTVVDFIQNRTSQELPEIAKSLLEWLGEGASLPEPNLYVRDVEEQSYEPERIQAIFSKCYPARYHVYLQSRGITQELMNAPRFKERIFFDQYENAVFPFYNKAGAVCGLELKNEEKGILVRGSKKTFWRSNCFKGDNTLVLGEAVIDALSYSLLHPNDKTVYAATGGGMSPEQCALLIELLSGFKTLETIILITDNDLGGDKIADKLREYIAQSDFKGTVKRHSPKTIGQDWNNVLIDE